MVSAAVWPAAVNSACYINIAIDSYIAAAGIFIVIAVVNAVNIAVNYGIAGNGETVTIAVNIIKIAATDNFSVLIYSVIIRCRCGCCCI